MSTNQLNELKNTISLVHGNVGKQWWQRLPQFLENLAHIQGLTLLSPFEHLSFNYVLPVLGSKGEIVPLGRRRVVDRPEIEGEIKDIN